MKTTAWSTLIALAVLASCARMGNPDGGWYDETPPHVVRSTPRDGGTGVSHRKVNIYFSEYIKLEDAQSKVIISPPQIEQADIRAAGKRIIVNLKDTLKPNTTYTVDFSDAIADNNEGNPMGNYTFSFSTGDRIDTLQVSGYCLNAEDLEPIKGIMVGLYPTDSLQRDSFFHKMPMSRVARTNGSGQFVIKGVAPGSYVIRALQDADGDFVFGQKSEMVGYVNDTIRPDAFADHRQDTLWRDSLRIDNVVSVGYTHFVPDDITLMCFQEPQTDRYLLKTERKQPERFDVYFTYGSDTLPRLRGLNFDADSAFVIEASTQNDTIFYWLRDTTLVNTDTLAIELTYLQTDSAGVLVAQTDTVEAIPKTSYEKRLKARQREYEKWQKAQEKKKKRDQPYDSIMPVKPLVPKLSASGSIDPLQHIVFEMPEPLLRCDTGAVHLYCMVDSVWYRAQHVFRQTAPRQYELLARWRLGTEYSLEVDSAAFESIYGLTSKAIKQGLKVKTADDYSSLQVNVKGTDGTHPVVVQLLDSSDKVMRQETTDSTMTVVFFYLKPGSYYLRAFVDSDGDGLWTTGDYDSDRQPEQMFYHSESIECKEKWDVTRDWNLTRLPLYRQKPAAITKQKPDKEKQVQSRNAERLRK